MICIDTEGNTGEVSVCIVKTESIPLLKIEAEVGDTRINTIVQDDWHICIHGQSLNVFCIIKTISNVMWGYAMVVYKGYTEGNFQISTIN